MQYSVAKTSEQQIVLIVFSLLFVLNNGFLCRHLLQVCGFALVHGPRDRLGKRNPKVKSEDYPLAN